VAEQRISRGGSRPLRFPARPAIFWPACSNIVIWAGAEEITDRDQPSRTSRRSLRGSRIVANRPHGILNVFEKLGRTFAMRAVPRLTERAKEPGGRHMLRSVLLAGTAAVVMGATAAMADNKSDCQKGVAMIKAELKKKHPAPRLVTLRKELSDAETEVIEEDWSECLDHIKSARAALSK